MAEEKKQNPYSDNYKQRYNQYLNKKRAERQEELQKKKSMIEKLEKEVIVEEKKIAKEIKEDTEIVVNYVKEPKHIKILKIIIILIALGIIIYLVYQNFFASQDFNYFYDIGSSLDAKKPYLTSTDRTSDIINDTFNYRIMTDRLVYFNVPIPQGSESLQVEARFKDNFPKNKEMRIGANDNATEWGYLYKNIFTGNLTREWVIESTSFNIQEDKLVIKNNQLSMLFGMPHLEQNATLNYTIPIDWIKIDVHKPGLIEKWNWNWGKLKFWNWGKD